MIKLKDILMESKADDVEFAIRRSFMHNPGSFNTGWKMTKREYLSLIKLLKKQYGSLVDKVVKELEKYQYIEPKGSQVIWNDGVEARPVIKEKSPKGWEGTVKSMKKDSDIDNPWALAHWMKKKGYKSHKKESVNEAKPKSYKFKFKCMECGKSFLKSLKKSLEVKCPKCTSVDIEIVNINEAKFSNDQIYIMRKAYGTLKAMNPSSPTYKKFIKFLDKLPKDQLKQLANAKIKFVSILAKNRLRGESVNEGEKRASNKLYVNVAKAYKVFAQEVLNLAQSSVKLMGGSSDKIIIMKNFQKHILPFMNLMKSWNKRQQENPHIKESDLDEGFGGELKGEDKKKFESEIEQTFGDIANYIKKEYKMNFYYS